MTDEKKQLLEDLHQELNDPRRADTFSNMFFHRVVDQTMNWLEMTPNDVSDKFAISIPTVNRWRNGVSAPHPAMRRGIFKWLAKQIERKLYVN